MKFWTGIFLGLLVGVGGTALVFLGRHLEVAADCQDEPCPEPPCCNGDADGDGRINVGDAVYVLTYLFLNGPAPKVMSCQACDSCCPPGTGGLPATGAIKRWDGDDGDYQLGCPMEDRFEVQTLPGGVEAVLDHCTGLMWQKDTADINLDGTIDSGDWVQWTDALSYCESVEFGEYRDWRLPNRRELESLVDSGRFDPAINPVFGCESSGYWSSSTYASHMILAWFVRFGDGSVTFDAVDSPYHVRAVRSGP